MIDFGDFITEVRKAGQQIPVFNRLALLLQGHEDAINQLGSATGTSPNDHIGQSDAPSAINVAAGSDHVHVTLSDTSQHSRALNYFVEWTANDPSFLAPNMEHLGVSRGRVLALPAKDGSGATISYYFRGYSHYLGAQQASKHAYWGSAAAPTAVQLTGSSRLTLMTSTGGGTAPTNGQRAGQGFGTAQNSELLPSQPKSP